ncbi:hypothetical protein [Solicola sp. PLA-1-18]|uniref:hypothetical protein n=1 Tax=Solicola sp. PLA-1-18 TaxID=3380532 RepID=UPI003B7AAC4F
MRRIVGGLVLLVGVVVAVAGAALMIVLGPDDRATTGPHPIDTVGVAVVTTPKAIAYAGPTVSVLAEVPDDKPVFVGLGNAVDVENYLGKTQRLSITRVRVPWKISTTQEQGEPNLSAAPTALDWWVAQSAGLGGASITVRLPDEPVSLAVLSVGDSDLEGLEITTAYDVGGGFVMGAGGVAAGLGIAFLGLMQVRGMPLRRAGRGADASEDDGDARYVFVDAEGVEHEVAPDDLDGYEIIDDEDAEPAAPVPAPAVPPPDAPGPAEPQDEEEVVYVLVDEDGQEREISASEADGLEVVEEVVEDVPADGTDRRDDGRPDDDPGGSWRSRLRRALGVE